jgi:hypothetical protein
LIDQWRSPTGEMTATAHEQLRKMRELARAKCEGWPENKVQFSVTTGWAPTYRDIFASSFVRFLQESEILGSVLKRGRAIISGRGGGGKTWLLRRLFKQAFEEGSVPILLDLKQWSGADYDAWKDWTASEIGDAADFIVRRFSGYEVGAIDLDRLPPDIRKVLLVDGLNEITTTVGAQVLQLLDEMVRDQINLSVLVADRLVRRELPSGESWSIGMTMPLPPDQVKEYLGNHAEVEPGSLLTSPFFLDAAISYGVEGPRRSLTSEKFLTVHGGLNAVDLDLAAAAAFEVYKLSPSRVFDRSVFAQTAGEHAIIALENSFTVVSGPDGTSYFVHHILHDYLASRHFAKLPTEGWTPQALSLLSFEASSFDAVELVFEQLDKARADLFLRQLYDWNLYAAGYALGQARDADTSFGSEMSTMIFAMLAEKRFDAILATRQRADDALALMQLSGARSFRTAGSLEAVFVALGSIASTEKWFNDWRQLFKTKSDAALSAEALGSIRNPDSIIGWTVANVAKRTVVAGHASDLLARWSREETNATVRWRIAHVLGAFPQQAALQELIRLLDSDTDGYVRYGAIRSIVELASRSDRAMRDYIASALDDRAEAIEKQPKIAGELRTCLLMHPETVAADWLIFVAKVVRSLFIVIDNTAERDEWRGCLAQAKELYVGRKEARIE